MNEYPSISGCTRPLVVALATAVSFLGASPAVSADVIGGNSLGYGAFVHLDLIGLATLTAPSQPIASGTAPGPYTDNDLLASLSVSQALLGILGTGVLNTTASSNVDGLAGSRFADASAETDNLNALLLGALTGISVTSDAVVSSALVTGDFGALSASGTTMLVNTSISVNGVALVVTAEPSPNTVIFNLGGLSIILNEQVLSGDGISTRGIEVNAIHISFDNFLFGGGLVNGDVIISHADADLVAIVPSPASCSLLGLAGIVCARRRRG